MMFVALLPAPFAVNAAFIVLVDAPADDVACSLIVVVAASVIFAIIGNTTPVPLTDAW